MPSVSPRLVRYSPRQALAMTLLLGAAGAGIAFLATRQGWAYVDTTPPKPLPASQVTVTGSALVPYADALVVAGLAALVAVLATRRVWRRITGLLLAVIGAALAASVFTLSSAGAVAAASSLVSPATNPGVGSVTQGSASASPVPNVAGTAPHVEFAAAAWQAVVVAGALAMIVAGLLVLRNARWFAVMSSRYDAPVHGPSAAEPVGRQKPDSASIWEALSRGEDPTAAARGGG
jgi:uncharacterized membrane protein (TIGR02234 family)